MTSLAHIDRFWQNNQNSIWLATTLSLHRNIDKFLFPNRLETSKKKILSDLIYHAVVEANVLNNPILLSYETMEALDKEYLYEHFLEFTPSKDSLIGESFILNEEGTILIKINTEDHLIIQGVETKGRLEEMLDTMQRIEHAIEKQAPFAFSNTFGYLTSDPTVSGTGLVVKAFLHVPALVETKELSSLLHNGESEGVFITGLQGSQEEIRGDMIIVTNRWTTGTTEESILSLVRTTSLAIASCEKEMRNKLHTMPTPDETILDRVSRCIGTLKFCHTMDTLEALRNLSIAKLGIELGWIRGISIEEINRQFFALRRAHIVARMEGEKTLEESNQERARLVRSLFEHVEIDT